MAPSMEDDPLGAGWAPLLDVTGVTVEQLLGSRSHAMQAAVARLVRSLDDPNGVISAFSSFVE